MTMTPHVLCAECGHVFEHDADMEVEVICPACGHRGPPGGIMRPSGFPTLDVFRRNIEKARGERHDD